MIFWSAQLGLRDQLSYLISNHLDVMSYLFVSISILRIILIIVWTLTVIFVVVRIVLSNYRLFDIEIINSGLVVR